MNTRSRTARSSDPAARRRGHVWLAGAIVILTLLLRAGSLIFAFLSRNVRLPPGWMDWQGVVVSALGALLALVIGALITIRRPHNRYGWLWLIFSFGFGLAAFAQYYAMYGIMAAPGALPLADTLLLLAGLGWYIAISTLPFILLLFPTGHLPSRRWRVIAWAVVIAALVGASVSWARPEESGFLPIENPLGVQGVFGMIAGVLNVVTVFIILGATLAGIVSLFVRFRRAQRVERQQIKWLVYAAMLFGVYLLSSFLVTLSGLWRALFDTLPLAFLPIAVGIAILRYRLYDIDIIIRKTLVYAALTLTLGLVYVGGILLGRALLATLTGSSDLAIVTSTLAIAALFNPLRKRIQQIIDKRFYRKKYDAAQVLAAFAATARDETDLKRLTDEMLRVVDETVQPEFVGLWLREGEGRQSR